MPYPKEFPYDLLGVRPDATLRDILAAYPVALARNRARAAEVQHAFLELRTPRRRLEYDVLLYCALGGEPEAQEFARAYARQSYMPADPVPVSVGLALTDLRNDDYRQDFRAVALRPARISVSTHYDSPAWELLPVLFER